MAGFLFNAGAQGLLAGTINWGSDTIRARLVESSESIDEDATAMTGIGVTGNDQTLGSKAGPTKDDANDRCTLGAGNPTFASQPLGDPVNRVVIFKFSTNDAGSTPIAYVEITEVTPNGGDISVAFGGGLVAVLNNQAA
jgi:hypothetical protein